ncbi:MAG TPA: CsbD family protein [Terriglobales bacterium]|jgi:uncharacterized protein YjbJ (UPF0337 family)|nr:CsbD family protein [Terriglobales bacterium]
MNKDRVEGKVKDVAGRIERQAGEWTGDSEAQVKGAAKQAEGKLQNTWGKVKDAAGASDSPKADRRRESEAEAEQKQPDFQPHR